MGESIEVIGWLVEHWYVPVIAAGLVVVMVCPLVFELFEGWNHG